MVLSFRLGLNRDFTRPWHARGHVRSCFRRPLESAIRPEARAGACEAVPVRPRPGHEKVDEISSKEEGRAGRRGFSVAQSRQSATLPSSTFFFGGRGFFFFFSLLTASGIEPPIIIRTQPSQLSLLSLRVVVLPFSLLEPFLLSVVLTVE